MSCPAPAVRHDDFDDALESACALGAACGGVVLIVEPRDSAFEDAALPPALRWTPEGFPRYRVTTDAAPADDERLVARLDCSPEAQRAAALALERAPDGPAA